MCCVFQGGTDAEAGILRLSHGEAEGDVCRQSQHLLHTAKWRGTQTPAFFSVLHEQIPYQYLHIL